MNGPPPPTMLPVLPGVTLSGRYLLGSHSSGQHGDVLDAVPLPDHGLALIVADVVGGDMAEVGGEHVRAILRERLGAGAGLADAMQSVDRYAHGRPELCATTACVAVIEPSDGRVEWSAAGHPPPLRWGSADLPAFLEGGPSRPLGTGGRAVVHDAHLDVGQMLGLYTNGLVTYDGRPLAEGQRRLCRAAAANGRRPGEVTPQRLDAVCDAMLHEMAPAHPHADDATLLIAARTSPARPLSLTFDAEPEQLPVVRRRINAWLDGLGGGLIDHVGLGHAVVELAANVIQHAYESAVVADRVILLEAELGDDGVARITVGDRGEWRPEKGGLPAHQDRGLMMASGLAESLRVDRSPTGTRIELTQRLTRPVPTLDVVRQQGSERAFDEEDELELEVLPGHLVASGPVDELSADLFHTALSRSSRSGTCDAVIDLDGVTHLGSPGVQTLFEFVARSARTGSHLTLQADPDSPAAQILELVGLPVG